MLVYFTIILTLALVSGAPDKCPEVKTKENFDFKKYATGRWYEIARYSQFEVEKGADCVIFDYDSSVTPVSMTLRDVVNKKETTLKTAVTLAPNAGVKAVVLYDLFKKGPNVTAQILEADYDNYEINYYCAFDEATKSISESAWVRSRTPTLKPEVKAEVEKFIASQPFLDAKKFVWDQFTHEDCLIDV